MSVIDLLGLNKQQSNGVSNDDSVFADLISGLEGLYGLLSISMDNNGYDFKRITGNENYAAGIAWSDGNDFVSVAGTEGFVGAIWEGLKSIVVWIKDKLKEIWNFFFGKSDAVKETEAIYARVEKDNQRIKKEVAKMEAEQRKKTEEQNQKLAKERAEFLERNKKAVAELDDKLTGDYFKDYKLIIDEYSKGNLTINQLTDRLSGTSKKVKDETVKSLKEMNADIKNAESSVSAIEKEIDKADENKQASIKEKVNKEKTSAKDVKKKADRVKSLTQLNKNIASFISKLK